MAMGQNNNNYPNDPNRNRGRRPTNNRRKEKIPGAVIAIYVMMAILILAICALIFVITLKATGWNGENQSDSSGVVLSSPEQGSSDLWISVDNSSDDSSYVVDASDISDPSSDDTSSDDPSSTDSDSSGSSWTVINLPTDYDPAIFDDDLFIGDSIFTGLYLYGYLDVNNVAAKVGYTPYNALHKDFSQTYSGSAADYAKEKQPKRIFIMLGSNAMGAGANFDNMVAQYDDLISALKDNSPSSEICVISIPPVTADSSAAASAKISNGSIDSVNVKLKNMAKNAKVAYLDLNAMLSDDDGYFMKEYAEMDGLHFKGTTYKVLLSALQREIIKTGGE
ncbi:MAG: hypothetical protein K2N56_07980 [Oscillospiraceae bacterium]|nr:hypothetical protein [Oscillospiraceae bacterium]